MLLGSLEVTVDEKERKVRYCPVVLAMTLIDRVYSMQAAIAAAHS